MGPIGPLVGFLGKKAKWPLSGTSSVKRQKYLVKKKNAKIRKLKHLLRQNVLFLMELEKEKTANKNLRDSHKKLLKKSKGPRNSFTDNMIKPVRMSRIRML